MRSPLQPVTLPGEAVDAVTGWSVDVPGLMDALGVESASGPVLVVRRGHVHRLSYQGGAWVLEERAHRATDPPEE